MLRKAYGLGAQAMMGGSTKAPLACVAWPTGEFGGMGLEGAVRLGYRKELEAVDDPAEREQLFQAMVDRMYEHGKALSAASYFEIDDVIDPADTRRWITRRPRLGPARRSRAPARSAPTSTPGDRFPPSGRDLSHLSRWFAPRTAGETTGLDGQKPNPQIVNCPGART